MNTEKRIAELEDTVKDLQRRIGELKQERDECHETISALRDYINDDNDLWTKVQEWFSDEEERTNRYNSLVDQHTALRTEWNKMVPKWNTLVAPTIRNFGRPLAASLTQCIDVVRRREQGETLRAIAHETGLGFQTVRTIIDKKDGVDRATLARLKRIAPDKFAEAHDRVSRKTRATLSARVMELQKNKAEVLKQAKGIA